MLAGLLAIAALAALIPTPIGAGPRFHPPAPPPSAEAIGGHRCGAAAKRHGAHLELFARGLVVIVPAGIGVARPRVRRGAYVLPRGCTYAVRTLEPTGVIEVAPSRGMRLG